MQAASTARGELNVSARLPTMLAMLLAISEYVAWERAVLDDRLPVLIGYSREQNISSRNICTIVAVAVKHIIRMSLSPLLTLISP